METRTSRKQEAYKKVRDFILSRQIAPGITFSESVLTTKLHISRTPVREALSILVRDGLIEQIPQVGIRIREVPEEAAEKLLKLREVVEGFVAGELATSAKGADLEILSDLLRTMSVAAKEKDSLRFLNADTEFHRKIAELSGYAAAADLLRSLRDQIMVMGSEILSYSDQKVTREVISEHKAIFNSIKKGNKEEAREAVISHIRKLRERRFPKKVVY